MKKRKLRTIIERIKRDKKTRDIQRETRRIVIQIEKIKNR